MRKIIYTLLALLVTGTYNDYAADFDELDCRTIDINDESHKRAIDDKMKAWKEEATNQMDAEKMIDIWQTNMLYYEGYQVPLGASSNYLKEFVERNSENGVLDTTSFRVQKDRQSDKIFFVDNKIQAAVDGMIGEYTFAKKVIQVKNDDNPKNNAIENIIQKFLQNLEETKQIWMNFRTPCIEGMMKLGLSWSRLTYNPNVNLPYGDIIFETLRPQDVFVDPNASEKYFLNARYVWHKKKMLLHEAKTYLLKFGIDPTRVEADTEYDADISNKSNSFNNNVTREQYVTLYFFEYRKNYTDSFNLAEHHEIEGELMIEEERVHYFEVIYNTKLGTIDHRENKYVDSRAYDQWQFHLTPYYNKQSGVRIYPVSDVEKLLNLQDIINITKSLILDNARQRNIFRLIVKKKIKNTYPGLFDEWLNKGGILPIDDEDDIRKAIGDFNVQELPKEVYEFLSLAEQSMKDMTIKHEALQGSYPKNEMSGVAIQKLQAANRRLINYKDVNIQWAATQEARLIYKILAEEFTEEDFIQITGAKKGDPAYIPINAVWSLNEYNEYLMNVYPGIELAEANAEFTKNNIVDITITENDEYGRPLDPEQIGQDYSIVYVNHLKTEEGGKFNLNIKVDLDFDMEKDKMEKMVLATELFKAGKFPLKRYLELAGFEAEADDIMKELEAENKVMQFGQAIVELGPDAEAMVLQLLNQIAQKKQGGNKAA